MNVKRIPLGSYQANCYLLEENGRFSVIDPGYYTKRFEAFLKESGVEKIDYIFLTHGHMDHICGAPYVKESFGGQLVIGEKDAEFLESYRFLDGALDYENAFKSVKADIIVRDGDTISFADSEISVLHTPGHTMGEVCYMTDDLLFTGDVLFKGSIGRSDFENSDIFMLIKSLRRLVSLPNDYRVLSGHGEETTLSHERQFNPYLEKIK